MLLKGKRIFIVEDNLSNRVVFQMMLLVEGATIEFERWGRDAVLRLQRFSDVDLIILDLMLHNGVSGYDIFQEIRQRPEFDKIPIVAVSAADASVAIPKTQQMGFSGFIAKPINDDVFATYLAAILAGEQVWHSGDRIAGKV
ncbi:MAG: response regulator [Anaerolineae bacterium]|nr:response regulator [Anaerolineae bacterium]